MRFNWFSYCDFKIENLKALRFSVHIFRSLTHFRYDLGNEIVYKCVTCACKVQHTMYGI